MNIKIESNFQFSVAAIQYAPNGQLCISLISDGFQSNAHYQYTACLGNGHAEEKPIVSLLNYAKEFASAANITSKTKDSYRLMCNHLGVYGDCSIDKVSAAYLQGFITYLQSQNLKPGGIGGFLGLEEGDWKGKEINS